VGATAAQRQPDERAAGVRAPERRAEPGQPRHEGDPGGVVDPEPEPVEVGRLGDQPDVAQPADRRPDRVHLPVQTVGGLVAEPPGHAADQPAAGAPWLGPDGGQQERAGAVGALGLPGVQARLGEQRRLLVDGQPGHRHRVAPERGGLPDRLGAADHGRQLLGGDPERPAGLLGPLDPVEVQQQGPRGGGRVGHERAGQPVQQPGVGGGRHPVGGEVLAQPGELGRGEVRVERQPGERPQPVGPVGEPFAHARRPPVLPGQRRRQRPAGGPIPGQHGLALVGEADGGDPLAGGGQRPATRLHHRPVQLLRVLLHPTAGRRGRVDSDLGLGEGATFGGDDQRLGGGGPLVDREQVHAPPVGAVRGCSRRPFHACRGTAILAAGAARRPHRLAGDPHPQRHLGPPSVLTSIEHVFDTGSLRLRRSPQQWQRQTWTRPESSRYSASLQSLASRQAHPYGMYGPSFSRVTTPCSAARSTPSSVSWSGWSTRATSSMSIH
jgi:hypothetical protein